MNWSKWIQFVLTIALQAAAAQNAPKGLTSSAHSKARTKIAADMRKALAELENMDA